MSIDHRAGAGRIWFAGLLVIASVSSGWAQQTGTLAGTVRDAQGAILPGATVTVTSAALIGSARSTVSGASGAYQVPALPPGNYEVRIDLTGFTVAKSGKTYFYCYDYGYLPLENDWFLIVKRNE